MLQLLLLASFSLAHAHFNITELIVPTVVTPDQAHVEIQCHYDANFTILNWFKGPYEFFRYKPGITPSTKSFPVIGVGKIDLIECGPTTCRLRLGGLTEEATGLYRCDIERETPPYLFASQKAYMEVHGHEHRKPTLEGLKMGYTENDDIEAYCRGAPGSEIRWYINGREVEDMRDTAHFKKKSSRLWFQGIPPTITVQCVEFRHGRLAGSKEVRSRWQDNFFHDETAQEHRKGKNAADPLKLAVITVFLSAIAYCLE